MFEDWKKAWQQAVENFQNELAEDDSPPGPAEIGAMRRDIAAARRALDRLQIELHRCQEELTEEQQQEQICRRRGEMAVAINDQTTVTIAIQWAERHRQRALILSQKTEVLSAELSMRQDDLKGMEDQVTEHQANLMAAGPAVGNSSPRPAATGPAPRNPERDKQDSDFRKLDREAREKAAEARLEELKKKMQS
jgi:hypothetical protein